MCVALHKAIAHPAEPAAAGGRGLEIGGGVGGGGGRGGLGASVKNGSTDTAVLMPPEARLFEIDPEVSPAVRRAAAVSALSGDATATARERQ